MWLILIYIYLQEAHTIIIRMKNKMAVNSFKIDVFSPGFNIYGLDAQLSYSDLCRVRQRSWHKCLYFKCSISDNRSALFILWNSFIGKITVKKVWNCHPLLTTIICGRKIKISNVFNVLKWENAKYLITNCHDLQHNKNSWLYAKINKFTKLNAIFIMH